MQSEIMITVLYTVDTQTHTPLSIYIFLIPQLMFVCFFSQIILLFMNLVSYFLYLQLLVCSSQLGASPWLPLIFLEQSALAGQWATSKHC